LVGEADYLVIGDEDMLVLEQVGGVKIVTPQQFVELSRLMQLSVTCIIVRKRV
jgi:predicted nucleic acid-binding protein